MCGGGGSPPPPPAPVEAPKTSDAEVKAAEDRLTEAEKRRRGRESTVLTGGEGVAMENIQKKKLMGSAREKLGV